MRFQVPLDSVEIFPEIPNGDSILKKEDKFYSSWYHPFLRAMNESRLWNDTSEMETFRFLWLRTFDNPIVIKIEKSKNKYTVEWKVTDGMGGYAPGKIITNEQINIDKIIWDSFKDSINKIDFWKMSNTEDFFGTDGSQWILEGKVGSQYHIVNRWTPHYQSRYYQCCNYLIGLTNLKIKDKY